METILDRETISQTGDIAITCFIINGIAKQLPLFITNDVTNLHVVKNRTVKIFSYSPNETKGQELNYFPGTESILLRLTDGREFNFPHDSMLCNFFKSPYATRRWTKDLMQYVFRSNTFHIDHLSNKITFTAGHIFYRLFVKNMYDLINENRWSEATSNFTRLVQKSLTSGDFSHVFSKKIIFFRDAQAGHKMSRPSPYVEHLREIGGGNNKIFVERKTTCYRDVNFQNYQLIPYLSNTVFFQVSEKAKMKNIFNYKDSHVGFLCVCASSDSHANIGRQSLLARDVVVSTCMHDTLEDIYSFLDLQPYREDDDNDDEDDDGHPRHQGGNDPYFVVVNNACIRIAPEQFRTLDLLGLKRRFETIECYRENNYVFVNYKMGMMFKILLEDSGIFATPRDLHFWRRQSAEPLLTFSFISSHMLDLIKFFNFNAFPKNVLVMNALRNAILSRTPVYSRYFKETVSTYLTAADDSEPVLDAVDEFSKPWVVHLPKLLAMFSSFRGLTQEDCIVLIGSNRELTCFNTMKTYTLKLRFLNRGPKYFRPSSTAYSNNNGGGGSGGSGGSGSGSGGGDDSSLMGTIVCLQTELDIQPMSTNILLDPVTPHCTRLSFAKRDFRFVSYDIYQEEYLFVMLEADYPCQDADKLCNLSGQKGVIRWVDRGPYGMADDDDGKTTILRPQMIINPEALIKRQTMGMVKEMIDHGGRDCPTIFNSDGKRLKGEGFIGPVFYFLINYRSKDHIYVADDCIFDKIFSQAVRGRSRLGGMKIGFQEIQSMRAHGCASIYHEKIFQDSDGLISEEGIAIPKSVYVVEEDMRFFKVTTDIQSESSVCIVPRDTVPSLS